MPPVWRGIYIYIYIAPPVHKQTVIRKMQSSLHLSGGYKVNIAVTGCVARISCSLIYQKFGNAEDVRFKLPTDYSCVCSFEAVINDTRSITGNCLELEEATAKFQASILQGRQAFIGKKVKGYEELEIQLGNIPHNSKVVIHFKMLQELLADEDGVSTLMFPPKTIIRVYPVDGIEPDCKVIWTKKGPQLWIHLQAAWKNPAELATKVRLEELQLHRILVRGATKEHLNNSIVKLSKASGLVSRLTCYLGIAE